MSWLTLLLSVAGFACLGFATDDHHHRLAGRRLAAAAKRRWRAAASVALALAFVAAVGARGWTFGPVLWFGTIMLAAGLAFLALNLGLRRLRGPHIGARP